MTPTRLDRVDYVVEVENQARILLRWNGLWARLMGPRLDTIRAGIGVVARSHDERPGLQGFIDRDSELLLLRGLLATFFGDGREAGTASAHASQLRDAGLLRDYQADAVTAALTAPWGAGIINVPMGGGKTRIAAAIAATGAALALPRWLLLTPNQELARQARRELAEISPELAAVLGAPRAQITVCSYGESLREQADWDGILVDEVHGLAATTRATAFARLRAGFRIGLSGTPLDRLDGNNGLVVGLCGPVVAKVELGDLQTTGALAKGGVRGLIYDHRTGKIRR